MTTLNENWEYNGLDLMTYAYSVKALGAPEQVPGKRGENITVPGKTGRVHVDKYVDERFLTLGMVVRGRPVSSLADDTATQLRSNLDALKTVFAQTGQHTLKHKAAGTTRVATAEVANVVEFTPGGPYHYDVAVEFVLADPWWYAEAPRSVTAAISAGSQNIAVANNGTWQNEAATLTVVGPCGTPKFAIGSNWVQYGGSVAAGDTLVMSCGSYTATIGTANVVEHITHDGALVWLPVPVGTANTCAFTCAGYGTATRVTIALTEAYV